MTDNILLAVNCNFMFIQIIFYKIEIMNDLITYELHDSVAVSFRNKTMSMYFIIFCP